MGNLQTAIEKSNASLQRRRVLRTLATTIVLRRTTTEFDHVPDRRGLVPNTLQREFQSSNKFRPSGNIWRDSRNSKHKTLSGECDTRRHCVVEAKFAHSRTNVGSERRRRTKKNELECSDRRHESFNQTRVE